MKLFKNIKLSVVTASLILGFGSSAFAADETVSFTTFGDDNSCDTGYKTDTSESRICVGNNMLVSGAEPYVDGQAPQSIYFKADGTNLTSFKLTDITYYWYGAGTQDFHGDGTTSQTHIKLYNSSDTLISTQYLNGTTTLTYNTDVGLSDLLGSYTPVSNVARFEIYLYNNMNEEMANFTIKTLTIDTVVVASNNTPTFLTDLSGGTHTVSIAENSANATAIYDVSANDGDSGATDANLAYSITAGNTNNAFAVNSSTGAITINDSTKFDTETTPSYIITIQADDGEASSNTSTATLTVNVTNVDNLITLSTSTATVAEDGGTSTITATLASAASENVTVNLAYGGTGTKDTDYTSATFITILSGQTTGTTTLTSTNDTLYDASSDETAVIEISTISGGEGKENGVQSKTVTITDAESAPTVTLSTGAINITEAVGSTNLTATLSNATYQNVTVNLAYTGTATGSGTDYSAGAHLITIPAGSLTGTTTLTAVQDALVDVAETIITDVSSVINATENATQHVTVTIVDDEDSTAPTIISVSIPNAPSKTGDTVTVTITVASDSDDYTTGSGGISGTIGGYSLANFTKTSDTTYTATYTVTAGGTDVQASSDIPVSFTMTDSAGNITGSFTTPISQTNDGLDSNVPTMSTISPTDNSTGKSITSNLILTLNEDAVKGTGAILIKKDSDDSTIETIDVTSGLVTISGATITINPSVTLDIDTKYYILVDTTAFDDTAGNSYAGITAKGDWDFTTAADATAPTISSISIPNTPNKLGDTVTVTFTVLSDTDNYTAGSGALIGTIGGFTLSGFTKVNDTTYTATYTVTQGGTDVLASADIPVNLTMTDSAGNVTSAYTTPISQNNDGLDSNVPTVSSLSPANNGTVSTTANFVLTLDENIAKGTGNIIIKKVGDNSTVETIDVTSGLVTIVDGVITINPSTTLDVAIQYYIQIDSGAFTDSVGNSYAGISDTTSWKFTTEAGTLSRLAGLTISKGSTDNTTKITYTPQSGNSLEYMYSNTSIDTPNYGDDTPQGAMSYTSGTDISAAEVGNYLIIYEVDSNGKIVGFKQQLLATSDINISTPITGTITKVSIPDILVDINTSKFVVDYNQSNDYNLSSYFTNVSNYSYILKDTNQTVDWLNLNSTTAILELNSTIVENNSTLIVNNKHFIKITGSNSDTNISTYFTLRFKDLNASLEQYMNGNVTLDGVSKTSSSQQNDGDGRIYDEKNFITADLNITTKVYRDGGARHEIVNRAIAESKLPDSKIAISADGDVNTTASTINDSGDEVQIEVLGMATGNIKSTHSILINGIQTKATSSLLNTITTVKANRTVETNATINGANISVLAKSDGKAEHTVEIGGQTTSASVELPGGQTVISTAGVVTTTYGKASAVTSASGTTQIQLDGNSLLNGEFEAGSSSKIYEDANGDEYIEVSTPRATSTTQYLVD